MTIDTPSTLSKRTKGDKMTLQAALTLSMVFTMSIYSSYSSANELVMSKEQQLMVSGSIKGVGCVKIKDKEKVSIFDKKKALLRAKSSLLTNVVIEGKEALSIGSDTEDNYKIVVNHISDGERVASTKPMQAYSFTGASGDFYCIRI